MAQYGDEDELRERELPDESDMDDGDETDTEPCPYCKREVHELSDICPHCGNFIQRGEAEHIGKSTWFIVAVVVCVVIVAMVWMRM